MDLDLNQYEVSATTGFLPEDPPLTRLISLRYAPWENMIDQLPALISASQVRASVDALPVISCIDLVTVEEFRRAYCILSLLANAYIWNGQLPSDVVPPCITVPLLAVTEWLETKPLVTYSSIVLWNYCIRPDHRSTHRAGELWSDPDNVESLGTFTGTKDENWFIAIMVAIEAQGGECIRLLMNIISAMSLGDDTSLEIFLDRIPPRLEQMRKTLLRLYERCSPDVFYHRIRPFHAGFGGASSKELPKGVRYVKVLSDLGSTGYSQFIGGSGAQSALLQCFDIVLGVTHSEMEKSSAGSGDLGFQLRMREYMPGPHKRFLEKLSEYRTVRKYITTQPEKFSLVAAFDHSIESLRAFRSAHIQIATRYIVIPSRSAQHANSQKGAVKHHSPAGCEEEEVLGTGGTSILPFLRKMRDETLGLVFAGN